MPSAVPAALMRVAGRLRCPVCASALTPTGHALRCAHAHAFDVSRHGSVTLGPPRRRPVTGDDGAMVAARVRFLDAQHFAPLTAALTAIAVEATSADAPLVLDVGAGPGHHLAAVLDALPNAAGVAFDASRVALRNAVRRHRRIAAVAGDVWHQIPLGDAAADVALNVFAPRNPAELARVVRPGGTLAVATPATDHLDGVAALHGVRVDPRKRQRLRSRLEPLFELSAVRHLSWRLRLAPHDVAAAVEMGPAARHHTPAVERRLRALPASLAVTAAVDLHVFRRRRRAGR